MKQYLKSTVVVLLLLAGCGKKIEPGTSTTPPSTTDKIEAATEIGKLLVENTKQISKIHTEKSYTVTDGVEATEISYTSYLKKRMSVFFLEIDLNKENITVDLTTPKDLPIGNGLERTTQQALRVDAPGNTIMGGINADFFTSTGPQGIFWHNGECQKNSFNATPVRPRSFFYLTKDKKAYTASSSVYDNIVSSTEIQEACGGGPVLVSNGQKIAIPDPNDLSTEPRTAIGVSRDGKTVYMMVVDGRSATYSNGMDFTDMSDFLTAIGSFSAINLDGGGSSTFFVRVKDGYGDSDRFEIRNRPSDGSERSVANAIVAVKLD